MYYLVTLGIAALLGLIPANIAKKKGHSFGLWWFYGWMLFIVAIIHVQFIEDYNAPKNVSGVSVVVPSGSSPADEIRKYRELADQGAITEEEFRQKKNQLLQGNASESSASDSNFAGSFHNDTISKTTVPAAGLSAAQHPIVIVIGSQGADRKVEVGTGTILAGRRPECKVSYQDGTPGISGRHCSIAWDSEKQNYIVRDLGSTYGTFLDSGMRLEANKNYRLRAGETIYLGDRSNRVKLELE